MTGEDEAERVRRRARAYRLKAEELRTAAQSMTDPRARLLFQDMIDTYEKLATDAEARAEQLATGAQTPPTPPLKDSA